MSVDVSTLTLAVNSSGVSTASGRLDQLAKDGARAEASTTSLTSSISKMSGFIATAAAGFAAWKLTEYIKEATLLAARVETLGVVMKVVGANAGYTSSQMDAFTSGLKKMGITTQESMSSLIKMAGAQMDLTKSSQLARVAQDAAVIGGINSSEAFGRMIQGIRSGEVEILKTIGISVQFEQGYKQMAASLGKTSNELTNTEKTASRMNQVLAFGSNIAGAYEASMSTAGKQILSMARYSEELKLKVGQLFTPLLTAGVTNFVDALKLVDRYFNAIKVTVAASLSILAGYTVLMISSSAAGGAMAASLGLVATRAAGMTLAMLTGGGVVAGFGVTTATTTVGLAGMGTAMSIAAGGTGLFAAATKMATLAIQASKAAFIAHPIGIFIALITTAIGLWYTYKMAQDDAMKAPKDNPVLAGLREEITLLTTKIELIKKSKGLESISDDQVNEINRLEMNKRFVQNEGGGSGNAFRIAALEADRVGIEKGILTVARLREEYNGLTAAKDAAGKAGGATEAEKEAARKAAIAAIDAETKAAKGRADAVKSAFTAQQDQLRETNPLLSEHQQALEKIATAYRNMTEPLKKTDAGYSSTLLLAGQIRDKSIERLALEEKLATQAAATEAATLRAAEAAKLAIESAKARVDEERSIADEMYRQVELSRELADLQARNAADSAQLTADQSAGKGFGFSSIDDQLTADIAAIAAKYDAERAGIQARMDQLGIEKDYEMGLINEKHLATMAAIEAENKVRYFNDKPALAAAAAAQISAEKGYQDKISAIKVTSAKNTTAMLGALNKALSLTYDKQAQEGVNAEKSASSKKLNLTADYTNSAADLFATLAQAQDQSSKDGFESAKALNMASAVMSTAAGIMRAYSDLGPVAGTVAAVVIAAAGAVQIAKIASTSFGGGSGSVSAPAGSFGAGSGSGGFGAAPMTSISDSTVQNSDVMIAAQDRNTLVIGKLSKTIEELNGVFKEGGTGSGLATNAPGRFTSLSFDGTNASKFIGDIKDTFNFKISGALDRIANLTNRLSGDAFFGFTNKWNTTGAGMSVGVNGGQFGVQDYTEKTKKGGWFTSDKKKTKYTDNADAGEYLNEVMRPFINDLGTMADTLGLVFDPAKYKADAVKISTAGKTSEQIGQELSDLMGVTLSGMALTIEGMGPLVGSYEDVYARIKQINDAVVVANKQLQLVGIAPVKQGNYTNADGKLTNYGVDAETAINSLYGGAGKFESAMGDYREVMYTQPQRDAQDLAEAQRVVNTGWAAITDTVDGAGLVLPKTNAEFNALVAEKGPLTVLGSALVKLGTSFAITTKAAEDAAKTLRDTFLDTALSAASALKDIMGGELSTLSPEEKYRAQQKAFADAQAAGRTAELPELGKALLTASRSYNGSSAGYTADYATVTAALADVAGMTDSPSLRAANAQVQLLTDIRAILDGGPGNLTALTGQLKYGTGIGNAMGTPDPSAYVGVSWFDKMFDSRRGRADNYNSNSDLIDEIRALKDEVVQLRQQSVGALNSIDTKARLAVNE